MAEPQILVESSADKLSRRDHIDTFLTRAVARGEPVRIRIPVTMYNYETRANSDVREAAWNLKLPVGLTTVDDVEALIEAVGKCLAAIARDGSAAVVVRVEGRDAGLSE